MTWKTARTWATNDLVTVTVMNDRRDSLKALSDHRHSGAAGDGAGLTLGVVLNPVFARHNTDAV